MTNEKTENAYATPRLADRILRRPSPAAAGSPGRAGGQRDVEISYKRDHAVHTLFLEQKSDQLMGSHRGEFLSGDINGKVEGANVRCHSNHHYEGTGIGYVFEGAIDGYAYRPPY